MPPWSRPSCVASALSDANLTDPEKTLERIGAALRASVTGLRQTLMARASIKDEFRIEQTMIRRQRQQPAEILAR